jgi:hypothetical protein
MKKETGIKRKKRYNALELECNQLKECINKNKNISDEKDTQIKNLEKNI